MSQGVSEQVSKWGSEEMNQGVSEQVSYLY